MVLVICLVTEAGVCRGRLQLCITLSPHISTVPPSKAFPPHNDSLHGALMVSQSVWPFHNAMQPSQSIPPMPPLLPPILLSLGNPRHTRMSVQVQGVTVCDSTPLTGTQTPTTLIVCVGWGGMGGFGHSSDLQPELTPPPN